MSKNLTFKLIMDGDSKGLVAAAKQSEQVVSKVFEAIKQEANQTRLATNNATQGIDQLGKESTTAAVEVKKLDSELANTNVELSKTNAVSNEATKGIKGLKTGYTALTSAMAAVGVGASIKGLADAADSYTNLSARIHIATKDGGDFTSAMAGVHQVALMTNSSLDATGNLFTKINDTGKEMGMTQQQALDLTKTINQAIKIGGGSAQASEAAVQQFIQALQSGVLRGDEFNSIMEQAPGLTSAMAKGLGVTTGELRKMAENGELGAERITKALQSQAGQIQATYDKFPTTIGNALQRITTSWEILIGKMDQANGASATVAQWLSVLADNLNIVEVLLNDIGDGFVWFGDQLKKIDPATIDALKTALLSAYDAVKSLGSLLAGAFERGIDVINTMLGQIFNFNSGIDSATDKTNGFTKALQAVNVVFGFISDGFKALNIGINLIIGAAYDAAGAFSYWKSKITFGDTSAQAVKDFEVMSAKAQEYYKKSSDAAVEFKSAGVEAIRQIGLTQDQKNAERVANNEKTLSDLKAQEAQHVADYKAISDERIKLQQQLVDARKSGDQSAIDAAVAGLAELDKKEKAYQAESKKISDEKIKAAQDWVNAQLTAMDGTVKAADAATQKTLQTAIAAQGLAVEFDKTGKAIVKAIEQDASGAVVSLDARLAQARKGAADLGLDLDVALNRVSEGFAKKATSLNDFTNNLELMGVKGKQAADVTYQAWVKWLETAKSQAEIDAAKAKLQSFGEQGKLSTSQVEMGMQAVKRAVQEIPDSLSPVEAAFERLGIKTKEQLKLAADLALNDFNTILKSGEATQDGLQQAYEETIRLAYASGDAQVIAAANAKAAYLGLEVQLDATGKATVAKLGEMQQAAVATQRTVSQVSQSSATSSTQPEISPEQQATNDHWDDFKAKMKARTDELNAKSQARGSGGGNASLLSNSGDSTQQISAVPDAPLIATSLDIQPMEGMETKQSVEIKIDMGTGQTATVSAAPDQATALEEMMRELEAIKGRS